MLSRKAKKAISFYAYQLGLTQSLVAFQGRLRQKIKNAFRILIYHRVNDFKDPFTIDSVEATDFEKQMCYVSRNYHVFLLEDIYNIIRKGKPLPQPCIAITFDDGYEDNYTYAYKVLRKYNLPATIFITVNGVETQTPLWFDRILTAFKLTDKKAIACPLTGDVFDIENDTKKLHIAHVMLEKLKKADNFQKNGLLKDILGELGVSSNNESYDGGKLLTWSQIKEMSFNKISFGSHTMTHPILATLPISDIDWELANSRKEIEKHTESEVCFFAYPNGKPSDYNEHVIQSVRKAGYAAAVTTVPEINDSATNCYTWGRFRPWQNRVEEFALALLTHGLLRQKHTL